MQGEIGSSLDLDFLNQLLELDEIQRSLDDRAASLHQANLFLAHENMRLRAARLAYENRMLGMAFMSGLNPSYVEQGAAAPWPQVSPLIPPTYVQPVLTDAMVKQLCRQGNRNIHMASEASTAVGPEPSPRTSISSLCADRERLEGHSLVGEQPFLSTSTSAMMRNLPNDYTRCMLLELLDSEGFAGTYDFLYLPSDFRSTSGLGYAFVNFPSIDDAERFRQHFSGFNRWCRASDKVCEVTWSSLQGLDAHIERYRNSPVMHACIPEEQKPALFQGLERVPFPPPTKTIRAPRHWQRRH